MSDHVIENLIATNVRRYPSPHGDFVMAAVLKRLHGDYVRAYVAIIRDASLEDREYVERQSPWIMAYGQKLSYEEARTHFLGIDKANYYD